MYETVECYYNLFDDKNTRPVSKQYFCVLKLKSFRNLVVLGFYKEDRSKETSGVV